jgi:hypothetical protein
MGIFLVFVVSQQCFGSAKFISQCIGQSFGHQITTITFCALDCWLSALLLSGLKCASSLQAGKSNNSEN